jgi:tetratricopeptide (TPR) repeat protein
MYLGDPRQSKNRRSSPVRVVILLLLIGFSLYLYALIRREDIEPPFVPTPTPTRSALSYASEADELYQQGKVGRAISVYEQAIALDPDNVLIYIPMVRLLTLERRLDEALALGQTAVKIAPENAQAWTALCMAYDWSGEVGKAIEAGQRAIELDPRYAEGFAYLAEAYADASRWAEATEAAKTALELDDRSADVYRNYGYVLEVQGNWSGAIEAYKQALERHPNLAYVHIAIGRNYLALGNYEAALEHFLHAVEIDPDQALANDQVGWTYFGLGEYEQAETYLKRATELDPEFGRAFGHLAINYWSRRNYEAAIPNFERAIRLELTAARQRVPEFYVTIESPDSPLVQPSAEVLLSGEFVPASLGDPDVLRATLKPVMPYETGTVPTGTVTLDSRTGQYAVELGGMPLQSDGGLYIGWFVELKTLSGGSVRTEPLRVRFDGTCRAEGQLTYVDAAPIEYYYTLGLAYYYLDQCEKSYPLFDVAMEIDPEDPNAIEGIRLCQVAEN